MAAKKERRERTIWEDKVIGGPLWATLVGRWSPQWWCLFSCLCKAEKQHHHRGSR
jgi:hypothetical protein